MTLVDQMLLNASLEMVKNTIDGFIRDGILYEISNYWEDDDDDQSEPPENEKPSVKSAGLQRLNLKEQSELSNQSRVVWCVSKSAIMAERAPESCGEKRTWLKRIAVKGLVHSDLDAWGEFLTLHIQFRDMGIVVGSWFTRTALWDLSTGVELAMLDGKLLPLPPKEWVSDHMRLYRGTGANTERPTDDDIQRAWDDLVDASKQWPEELANIQRLKDITVEEATAIYFAELDAGGARQSQPKISETIDKLKQDAAKAESKDRGQLPVLFLSLREKERLRAIDRVFARLRWRSEPKELDSSLNHVGYYVWIRSIRSKPYVWRYKYPFTIEIDMIGGTVLVAPPSAGYGNAKTIREDFLRLLEIECTLRGKKTQNGNPKTGNTQKIDREPKIKTRSRYAQRDKKLCERWQNDGLTDDELAREFHMSPDNVKKIRYKHGYKDHEKTRENEIT